MDNQKHHSRFSPLWVSFMLLVALTAAFAIVRQVGLASSGSTTPAAAEIAPGTPVSLPPALPEVPAVSLNSFPDTSLSYYFISGNTFTPDGSPIPYVRQVVGCVNQMPLNIGFSAPVHLPKGSQVVSITLYSYDSAMSNTTGTAYFLAMDGMGNGGYYLSASSLPNTVGYQQQNSVQNNPATVDEQYSNYLVQWRKLGDVDSTYLSLCGVRIAYYPPLGKVFLPVVSR